MPTTIEQSQELMKYLPLETADMGYTEGATIPLPLIRPLKKYDTNIIPAWSLDALLKLMPAGWEMISYKATSNWPANFIMAYGEYDTEEREETKYCSSPFEAAFEMIKYLIKNNLINFNNKENK